MNRKFYLIDRENGNEKRRITLREIADHFNGDGSGEVSWTPANVDLDRFAEEMDEIGYTFIVERGNTSSSERAQLHRLQRILRTAEKKLSRLSDDRSMLSCKTDRFCAKHMEKFYAQLGRVETLRKEVAELEEKCRRV